MRFPSQDRFLQYCVSKRRTHLRVLLERRNPRAFFELWKGQYDFAGSAFSIDGLSPIQARLLGRALRWLLLQELHQTVRAVVPDFAPVPPTVVAALPGAMHQVRVARSMLIAGESGSGKEQLAVLLHVLAGRPGAMVRVGAAELGRGGGSSTRGLMPERGSVFIGNVEEMPQRGQEELLAFLNGEARRRDLLFFASTRAEPRELVSRHGLRRDLFVRVSQTEVRLPPLRARFEDVVEHASDVLFDLVRVSPERLAELRTRARPIAEEWSAASRVGDGHDFFAEALSWVMWREKARLATAMLAEPWCSRLFEQAAADDCHAVRARVAAALDRHDGRGRDAQRAGRDGGAPTARAPRGAPEWRRADAPEHPRHGKAAPRADERADRATPPVPAEAPAEVPTDLGRDELLRRYYLALLAEEHGDLLRVAVRAGRHLRSLHAELARLGVRLPREAAHAAGAGRA